MSVLSGDAQQKQFGIYATESITGPKELAVYIGEVREIPEDDDSEDSNMYYSFDLDNGKEISALTQFGWPALVNGASCFETANIAARIDRSTDTVYYSIPDGVSIAQHEQALVYYGDYYTFDKHKRFLNPSDNEEDSADKLRKYPYIRHRFIPDATLCKLLNVDDKTRFFKPSMMRLSRECVNIPLLACDEQDEVLPQYQQENITLLHLACWENDELSVVRLLALGANVNQQSSRFGYSVIHLILLSPHYENEADRWKIIQKIIQKNKNTLRLQDHKDYTSLHYAISNQMSFLIPRFIEHDPKLKNFLNKQNHDFFLLAIKTSSVDVIQAIAPYVDTEYLDQYLPTDSNNKMFLNSLSRLINNLKTQDVWLPCRDVIKRICEKNSKLTAHLEAAFTIPSTRFGHAGMSILSRKDSSNGHNSTEVNERHNSSRRWGL